MKTRIGNILDVTEGLILQQANAQGVMGSGVAKAIRERYPIVFEDYTRFCVGTPSPDDRLGEYVVSQASPTLLIVSIIGQLHYGRDGSRYTSYDALDTALQKLGSEMRESQHNSGDVHHPLLGAGLGGGHWNVIREIIEHRIGKYTTLWMLP